ncbi:MAG: tRNA 4-thiouridine(8) synthase ThiI [Planctomycetes bacterium]|nr:tRNA 4-thiouridine(8) synthase ThiI [Planctomycetota bacterium]HJO25730.1 tRNA uracil 4-sulfurtransferase ThiI [Planctomycetota bacterium]
MTLAPPDLILARFGEIALKKGNRGFFEKALRHNLRQAATEIAPTRVTTLGGRVAIIPEGRVEEVAERVKDVFGLVSLSPAWSCPSRPQDIVALAREVLADALAARASGLPTTVRIKTSRADKTFPMNSVEMDKHVAEHILPGPEEVQVKLRGAQLEVGIDIRSEASYIFVTRVPGPGGLPVGTLGHAVSLLSGGIDSPAASWLAMKRGLSVSYVSFHSPPYIGDSSRKKIVDLVRILARYQPTSQLHVVPFTRIQETIRERAPAAYRTVLYRRFMQRIATAIARRERAGALITGESLGQVASQTLENMTCIEEAAGLPVLRPLLTYDKGEAIDLARRIGTFDTSIIPEPDCCTVFMPPRPVIRGRLELCLRAEQELGVEELEAAALAETEQQSVEAAAL